MTDNVDMNLASCECEKGSGCVGAALMHPGLVDTTTQRRAFPLVRAFICACTLWGCQSLIDEMLCWQSGPHFHYHQ